MLVNVKVYNLKLVACQSLLPLIICLNAKLAAGRNIILVLKDYSNSFKQNRLIIYDSCCFGVHLDGPPRQYTRGAVVGFQRHHTYHIAVVAYNCTHFERCFCSGRADVCH